MVIPKSDLATLARLTTARNEHLTVRREDQARHLSTWQSESQALFRGCQIPEHDAAGFRRPLQRLFVGPEGVVTRGQRLAVRRNGHGMDDSLGSLKGGFLFTSRRVPQLDMAIEAACRQRRAIRGKSETPHALAVARHIEAFRARGHIP
jgi:hypothetical protein